MKNLSGHLYILTSLFFTGSSQILMRWQVSQAGEAPPLVNGKIFFIISLLIKPWILVAMACTFLGGVIWMLALSKFELSYAYPWTGLLYIYILLAGYFLFNDAISLNKVLGTLVIIFGVFLISR
jgi:multidrug transporter EmrE-like cation transporter